MDVNGIYTGYQTTPVAAKEPAKTADVKAADTKAANTAKDSYSNVSATYESSAKSGSVKVKQDRSAIIAQLKADSDARIAQMQSLVTQMFSKQGVTIGTTDDMWKMLADGKFTADPETIAQAKKDIAEDGYWGVDQTSERIFSFATALSGGNDAKMQEMVKAVEKGFKEATKTWGKNLPDISNKTFDAVMKKFHNWFTENHSDATTANLLK